MSFWSRRVSITLIVTAVAVVVLGVLAVAFRPPSREITLIVKNMTFYVEGREHDPNPMLFVNPGERVRVVLKNQERGVRHDFAVPASGAALDLLSWNQSGEIVFDVPGTPGKYDYWCRPHMTMMRGTIVVMDYP
jgi:plastocyanin